VCSLVGSADSHPISLHPFDELCGGQFGVSVCIGLLKYCIGFEKADLAVLVFIEQVEQVLWRKYLGFHFDWLFWLCFFYGGDEVIFGKL